MKRILVTGGAGFIGSHLSEMLLSQDFEVVCIDNFNEYYSPNSKRRNIGRLTKQDRFTLFEGDILNLDLLQQIFRNQRIDVVVHLAARAGVRASIKQPMLYQQVNVEGTTNLLEMAKEFEVEKFIFGSSSSVYGENKKVPFSEEDPVDHPISPYAATKKSGELICYTYHHLYELPVACLRFFTVYGPRQRPDMAIHRFTKNIYAGDAITMFGDGKSRRDYTYITDIIDGICKAIDCCESYHIYNLGESRTIELSELIELIGKCLSKKPKIETLPVQPGDVPITYADISKARNEIGYEPRIGIEQGVENFVKWYVEMGSS
ncbi:NAD-dependent epimerase/dehydratase family protein [candidate division KSB1 bacterium]|nr:NAD-dependent epimerase/dehydratase family protein [candidate division KSB1 bacterium]NIR72169.1 NAD-dependent epimerase/dehydratase family protein [candidate division KSB1 bacterium]NIS26634.1 NAD-dependent epimerase/dehydratase family protein [candidate division KSB1 bacterium]NIT73402.1 NAD-dependent epimerase/dehydratase family protein [candidate division KSB1 bacterium]NIU27250.1 NAD-dependent epimerase/dehydratase family protein [candidate division KSB1 bacterium]